MTQELKDRLRELKPGPFTVSGRDDDDPPMRLPINPDGPEAAARIEQLEAEIASLREGLTLARTFIGGGSCPDDPAIKLLQTDIDALLKGQGK